MSSKGSQDRPGEGEATKHPSASAAGDRGGRVVELAGLALALAGLSFFLSRSYMVKAWSDPVQWFTFGQDFAAGFGQNRLAYLFPLLIAAVTPIVGPFRAFLVNVPLLLVLALLLYGFGRQQLGGARHAGVRRWAPHAGAATLLVFAWVETTPAVQGQFAMLHLLSSPYRDVLAHVLLVAALIALVAHRHSPRHALAPAALSGALVALAASAREASVVALAPMALYAVACRLSDRSLPFLRPMLVFGAAFTIALLPLLAQNFLYSGNPFIPSQAADPVEGGLRYSSVAPGVALVNLRRKLPPTLDYLQVHYGVTVLALMALGVVFAIRHRLEATLYLALPGALVYTGFYGAYTTMVQRYLFVVDLFALPLAGVGVAGLVSLLAPRAQGRAGGWVTTGGLLGLLAGTAMVAVHTALPPGAQFRIGDAQALQADARAVLPADARVLGDRPLAEIFRSFVSPRTQVLEFLVPSASKKDEGIPGKVDEVLADGEPVYLVTSDEDVRRRLGERFDLELVHTFYANDYRLDDVLGFDGFPLHRVRRWPGNETVAKLEPHRDGRQVLALDVGKLSGTGGTAALYWNDTRLDPPLRDGLNCYPVDVDSPAREARVRLVSDRPVPGDVSARLSDPIRVRFQQAPIRDELRAAGCIVSRSALPAARVQRVAVPVVRPEGAAFVFGGALEIESSEAGPPGEVVVRAAGEELHRGSYPRRGGAVAPAVVRAPFALSGAQLAEGRALVELEVGEGDRARVRFFEVSRHALRREARVRLGRPGGRPFVRGGFSDPVPEPEAAVPARWTRGRASLWLLAAPGGRGRQLLVDTVEGWRPQGAAPAAPRFRLNGLAIEPIEEVGRPLPVPQELLLSGKVRPTLQLSLVTRVFDVPPERTPGAVNLLEIDSTAWVPEGPLPGVRRGEAVGAMVSRVVLVRAP